MQQETGRYHFINDISGVLPTLEGDRVAIDCIIDDTHEFFAVPATQAVVMAIYLLAGAKTCGYLQYTSAEQKIAPGFDSDVQAVMDDALEEFTSRLISSGG